jgi:hypothetical protein
MESGAIQKDAAKMGVSHGGAVHIGQDLGGLGVHDDSIALTSFLSRNPDINLFHNAAIRELLACFLKGFNFALHLQVRAQRRSLGEGESATLKKAALARLRGYETEWESDLPLDCSGYAATALSSWSMERICSRSSGVSWCPWTVVA